MTDKRDLGVGALEEIRTLEKKFKVLKKDIAKLRKEFNDHGGHYSGGRSL